MVFGVAFNACNFDEDNEPLEIVSNVFKSMQGMGLNTMYRFLPFLEVRMAFGGVNMLYFLCLLKVFAVLGSKKGQFFHC